MPYRTAVPHPQPSLQDRPPSKPAPPTYHEAGRLSRTRVDERHQPISDREAERLAEKIVSVGGSWSLAGWLAAAAWVAARLPLHSSACVLQAKLHPLSGFRACPANSSHTVPPSDVHPLLCPPCCAPRLWTVLSPPAVPAVPAVPAIPSVPARWPATTWTRRAWSGLGRRARRPTTPRPRCPAALRCAVQDLLRRCGGLLCSLYCSALLVLCSAQRRPLKLI
jgi:hypothetical protein